MPGQMVIQSAENAITVGICFAPDELRGRAVALGRARMIVRQAEPGLRPVWQAIGILAEIARSLEAAEAEREEPAPRVTPAAKSTNGRQVKKRRR